MRRQNISRLVRNVEIDTRLRSKSSKVQFVVLLPLIVVKASIFIGMMCVAFYVASSLPRAIVHVSEKIRGKMHEGKNVRRTLKAKGGIRQNGYIKEGFHTRMDELKNYDDIRRRLDELRSTGTGDPARGSLNLGGQNGKQ